MSHKETNCQQQDRVTCEKLIEVGCSEMILSYKKVPFYHYFSSDYQTMLCHVMENKF